MVLLFFSAYVCHQYDFTFSPYGSGKISNHYIISGFVKICDNNEYIPVCRDGVSDISLHYICASRYGYYGQLLKGHCPFDY